MKITAQQLKAMFLSKSFNDQIQQVVTIDRGLRYGIECEQTNCINGFMFNDIGDLISKPENYTRDILIETYDRLIENAEYIRASRINHLINIFEE